MVGQVGKGAQSKRPLVLLQPDACGLKLHAMEANHRTGQIITTSAEVTLNGGLIRELPQNPLNSGLGIILICPDRTREAKRIFRSNRSKTGRKETCPSSMTDHLPLVPCPRLLGSCHPTECQTEVIAFEKAERRHGKKPTPLEDKMEILHLGPESHVFLTYNKNTSAFGMEVEHPAFERKIHNPN